MRACALALACTSTSGQVRLALLAVGSCNWYSCPCLCLSYYTLFPAIHRLASSRTRFAWERGPTNLYICSGCTAGLELLRRCLSRCGSSTETSTPKQRTSIRSQQTIRGQRSLPQRVRSDHLSHFLSCCSDTFHRRILWLGCISSLSRKAQDARTTERVCEYVLYIFYSRSFASVAKRRQTHRVAGHA